MGRPLQLKERMIISHKIFSTEWLLEVQGLKWKEMEALEEINGNLQQFNCSKILITRQIQAWILDPVNSLTKKIQQDHNMFKTNIIR
jgi:hypothetical protein